MPMIYRLLIIVANFALSSSFQNQHSLSFLPATSRIQGTAVETPEDTINNAKGVLVRVNPIKRLQVTIPASPISITSADIDSHIKANPVLDYELKNVVNFVTLGGVQPGNVAVCDWTSVHLEGGTGFAQNQNMKGVAKNGHEIDVNFEQPEPWATFARKLVGSGQMQTTTFEASFPDTYPVERMKNVRARFTVNVKKIMEKVPIEKRDISEGKRAKRSEAKLEEDENTRDGSREMAADGYNRAKRVFRKTRILAMDLAKWLQTATTATELTIYYSTQFIWLARRSGFAKGGGRFFGREGNGETKCSR